MNEPLKPQIGFIVGGDFSDKTLVIELFRRPSIKHTGVVVVEAFHWNEITSLLIDAYGIDKTKEIIKFEDIQENINI